MLKKIKHIVCGMGVFVMLFLTGCHCERPVEKTIPLTQVASKQQQLNGARNYTYQPINRINKD